MNILRNSRICLTTALLLLSAPGLFSAQPELPEVTVLASVPNFGFAAIWVAEQLDLFSEEGVKANVAVAGGGSTCLAAVVGRSAEFCASSSDGLIMSRQEGAPLIAIQAHNENVTLSVTVRKEIAERFSLTRDSPIEDRLRLLTQLGTIGATSPGAASQQVIKFLAAKSGGDPEKLQFVFLGGAQLPTMLMSGVIDAFALSPPSGETTEAAGKGYVLIPLSRGEVAEVRNYPYEVLVARPDVVDANPVIARAVSRAISRGGALIRQQPEVAKAALRAHHLFSPQVLQEEVFELAFSNISDAIPLWGNMTEEGWQRVIQFVTRAGMIRRGSDQMSAAEGHFWTNRFVGTGP